MNAIPTPDDEVAPASPPAAPPSNDEPPPAVGDQLALPEGALLEVLARELHEAGRAAVAAGLVLNKVPGQSFTEWADLPEDAREGRRIQARYLLRRGLVDVEALVASLPPGTPPPPPEPVPATPPPVPGEPPPAAPPTIPPTTQPPAATPTGDKPLAPP